jgi:hypothetical protein
MTFAEDLTDELPLAGEIHPSEKEGTVMTRKISITVVVIQSMQGLCILIWI